MIGKSRSHVANTLRLLKLPSEVKDMLARGELTAGHARTLITADDPLAIARQIVGGGLSVRAAEALSQKGGGDKKPSAKSTTSVRDADTAALEKRIADALGMSVNLDHKAQGGRIEIKYKTLEQLDMLSLKLTGYGG